MGWWNLHENMFRLPETEKADNCRACFGKEHKKLLKTELVLKIEQQGHQHFQSAYEAEQKNRLQFRSDILAILNTTPFMSLERRMKEYFKREKL